MILFHGTQPVHLASIDDVGICPPSAGGQSNWQEASARPDLVYLTSSYPLFFGRNAMHPGVLAIEVDIDVLEPQLLLPDEDYIVQTGQVAVAEGQHPHDIAKTMLEDFQSQWSDSLDRLGTCAYKGVIPKAALRRICVLSLADQDAARLWLAAFNVEEISIEYHAAEGERHHACTLWAFGDGPLPPDVRWDGADRRYFSVR